MDKNEAYQIAKRGALFIARNIKDDGKFIYGFTEDGIEMPGYNILRHCGCIWALEDVFRDVILEDPIAAGSLKIAIDKTIKYLIEKHIWRQFHTRIVSENSFIKVGGVALAMNTLLRYHKIFKKRKYIDISSDLSMYIRKCTDENGYLVNHKVNMRNSQPTDFVSDYYLGQCILAQCNLYETKPSSIVLDNIFALFNATNISHIHSHWLLQAFEKLNNIPNIDKKKLIELSEEAYRQMAKVNEEFMTKPETTRPEVMGCHVEGFVSFYNMCEKKSLKKKVLRQIEKSLEFQKKFQNLKNKTELEKTTYGAFTNRDGKMRTDYTQHAISGYIRYSRI